MPASSLRFLLILILIALVLLLKNLSPWTAKPQEYLISRYYRSIEPDWRKIPPASAATISPADELPMPSWYGNSSLVGPSPYDFFPSPLRTGERKTRILFLLDYPDYLTRMNSHSYEIVDAAKAHPRLQVDVWGDGWAGWDNTLSISANIAKRRLPGNPAPLGCGYYDLYWTASNYPSISDKLLDNAGCGTVHYHQLGDCHNDECIGNVFTKTGNITASKYAFELFDMMSHTRLAEQHPDTAMQLFTHSPDAANPWDYFPLPKWSHKSHPAVMFGAWYDLYTIRPVVGRAAKAKRTFITLFSHPGFNLAPPRKPKKMLTYIPGHMSYARQRAKRTEFAEGMRNAQICVFDSSMEKKAIRKYAQAFLSGCVVAADLPTEQEEAFRDFMIVLRPQASIYEINTIIYQALQDPSELQRKALAGFTYAREFLTNTRKIDRVVQDVSAYKAGRRGYSVRSIQFWHSSGSI